MASHLLVGKTVFRQISAQVVLLVFIVCFPYTEVSGTCRLEEGVENCSLGTNTTCPITTCLDEDTDTAPADEIVGELQDNPDHVQTKFYSNLSAENKSLLLYILMGKYEETLERAQMEISRGLQQRNELRALMG